MLFHSDLDDFDTRSHSRCQHIGFGGMCVNVGYAKQSTAAEKDPSQVRKFCGKKDYLPRPRPLVL